MQSPTPHFEMKSSSSNFEAQKYLNISLGLRHLKKIERKSEMFENFRCPLEFVYGTLRFQCRVYPGNSNNDTLFRFSYFPINL